MSRVFNSMITYIEHKVGKSLTTLDINRLSNIYIQTNPKTKESVLNIIDKFMKTYNNKSQYNRENYMNQVLYESDPSESLIKNTETINISSVLNAQDLKDAILLTNPQSRYKYVYLCIDSRYRNLAASTPRVISFDYSSEINNPMDGVLYSNIPATNIVAMRLYRVTLPQNFIGIEKINRSRTATIIMNNFDTQFTAFSGQLKYHFLMTYYPTVINSQFVINYLDTDDPQGATFYFRQPIRQISHISLSIGNPSDVIEFYDDSAYCTVQYAPGYIIFVSSTPHNMAYDYVGKGAVFIVQIKGFTTNTPDNVLDKELINRINAIQCINVEILDDYTFRFATNINPSTPIADLVVSVRYVELSLQTYLELICLDI